MNNITELQIRREECLACALLKIESVLELTQAYKMKRNQEKIRR
jgi:hypothetical protein